MQKLCDELQLNPTKTYFYIRDNKLVIADDKIKLNFDILPELKLVSKQYEENAEKLTQVVKNNITFIKNKLFDKITHKRKQLELQQQLLCTLL